MIRFTKPDNVGGKPIIPWKIALNFHCAAVIFGIEFPVSDSNVASTVKVAVLQKKKKLSIFLARKVKTNSLASFQKAQNVSIVSFRVYDRSDFAYDLHLHLYQIYLAVAFGSIQDGISGYVLEMRQNWRKTQSLCGHSLPFNGL